MGYTSTQYHSYIQQIKESGYDRQLALDLFAESYNFMYMTSSMNSARNNVKLCTEFCLVWSGILKEVERNQSRSK